MRRFAVPVLVLALLAAVFFVAWKLTDAGEGPRAGTPSSEAPAPTDEPPVTAPVEAPTRESVEPATSDAAHETGPAAPTTARADRPPERPAPALLNGAAVRVDPAGVEHAGDDGAFRLIWRRGADVERRTVEVLAGRFSVEVPPDVVLHVRELVLGGIPLLLEQDEISVPADRFVTLRGDERRGVLLHVVSAADGRELSGVDVWPGPYSFPTDVGHPGAEPEGEPVFRDAASPVRIAPRADAFRSTSQYFVRAPGHAWGSIAIDHAAGGERTLELQPSCTLTVELIGSAEWLEPDVALWPPDASQWDAYAFAKQKPDAEDRAVFEALPPGTYLASVERGWADRRQSYGSARVTLVAGETATVPIRVELPDRPRVVTVSGTLAIPSAWAREGVKLAFGGEGPTEKWLTEALELSLAAMEVLDGGPEAALRRAWSVELPTAGSYRLEILPFAVRLLLAVPEEGLDDVDLVVPAPADVEVAVIDDATGEEIAVESLRWSPPRTEGILATPVYTAVRGPESGRVSFRVPTGDVHVRPSDFSLRPVDEDVPFPVEPGPNLIELRVYRQIGVRFTFTDGEATIPWTWNWRLSAHRTDGGARDVARSVGMLWFREEGTYELRSKGIPGYQSIDGTPIEVRRGQGVIEVEVRLVRE